MEFKKSFISSIFIFSLLFSNVSLASCVETPPGEELEPCKNPGGGPVLDIDEIIIPAVIIVGVGLWFILKEDDNSNIETYKHIFLSDEGKKYKFFLAPVSKDDLDSISLQFSYGF